MSLKTKIFKDSAFLLDCCNTVLSHGCLRVEKSACLLTADIDRGSLGSCLIAKAQPNQDFSYS